MKLPHYHESLETLHVGTLNKRSYYIPFGSKDIAELPREASDRMMLLSGDWAFFYAESDRDLPEDFYAEDFDYSGFNAIPVPSNWQNFGYGYHNYLNVAYPFPYDPPYVPEDNACGVYIRTFEALKDGYRKHLVFEGVDSCYYVWVNGEFAGFSQISHSMSEFDITDLINDGENRLTVLVYRWCAGSYLEDQDKLRMSGIFRDVYILDRAPERIDDFFVRESFNEEMTEASVSVEVLMTGNEKADRQEPKVSLQDPEGKVYEGKISPLSKDRLEVTFEITDPLLWNAEDPVLYRLYLETEDEVILKKIGLREIEVKDAVIYLNRQKIKFKGVNHHDSSPVNGYAMTKEEMLKDLTMIKSYNMNAVRTSHYPSQPYFYEICDEIGLYVIDEADIEAHGTSALYGSRGGYGQEMMSGSTWSLLADDPDWYKMIFDRIESLVERDKNCACVVIWSMGNEAGFGGNFEKSLEWVKFRDPSRLTQYEGSVNGHIYDPSEYDKQQIFSFKSYERNTNKFDLSNLDIYSEMYPAVDKWLKKEEEEEKPILLVEYAHAMGNGPGDLEDYWKEIYAHDKMCGGFVWEWCDHAVYMGTTKDGKEKYFYGGDWGDLSDSKSFCMDGLVYPDRTPSTGLLEYKNVLRPVRFEGRRGKTFTFRNMLDFTNLYERIGLEYEILRDGEILCEGSFYEINCKPHDTFKVTIQEDLPKDNRTSVIFSYISLDPEADYIPEVLGYDQVLLGKASEKPEVSSEKAPRILEEDYEIVISGDSFRYTYDKQHAAFTSLVKDQKSYITDPVSINIWRAPTDNDMRVSASWRRAGYDRMQVRVYETKTSKRRNLAVIESRLGLSASSLQKYAEVTLRIEIADNGAIGLKLNGKRLPVMPAFPRFGLRFFLEKSFKQVSYYGYGPYESYIDKHQSSVLERFDETVEAQHEDYLMPQENGSHYGCEEVILSDGKDRMIRFTGTGFSFNASEYTEEELTEKKHAFELEKSQKTVLCIDGHMAGIGSNSCGPVLMEKYEVPENMELEVVLDLE